MALFLIPSGANLIERVLPSFRGDISGSVSFLLPSFYFL